MKVQHSRTGIPTAGVAILVALTMSLTLALASGASASAAPSGAAASDRSTVASTPQGKLRSRVVGTTGNGRRVTGDFVPMRFVKRDGKVFVRGLIQGVVHNADGSTRTFAAMRTMRVKSIGGAPVKAGKSVNARATCDILDLVLGPLDLDLLGLRVHLDRVVLTIIAATGAGNLLGNLLCAVTGLLDGGLNGLLGRLVLLLNRILSQLGLGL
ncbi:hypothetical protein LRP67_17695 [Nocardioides sp. cx-169]|uniref:hypothetical protein n=1 Tax=Nocardioides sp. cx-169 TaxID=2899080 RepID=UPI001E3931CA|nr:hypothetical protein [Nocardioides sp. cx-169]MCD4535925.1 hypothetical protein [Nocardioides sp. cx-169]